MKNHNFSLFSELYTSYYQVIARILTEAADHPLTRRQIENLAGTYGGEEGLLSIAPKLLSGEWPFFVPDPVSGDTYHSVLSHRFSPLPFTRLQKSWLKALMGDPRFRLFFTDRQSEEFGQYLSDISPLYRTTDFCLFDQYGDHDPFSSVIYREHMQALLKAVGEHRFLSLTYLSGKGNILTHTWLPCRLEYGQRDGKFRLYALAAGKNGKKRMDLLNVARILSLKETDMLSKELIDVDEYIDQSLCRQPLILEITTRRNGLERAMLHFSCYQKKVERQNDTKTYRCTIYYDVRWETELLIQVLSFGPVVKVLGPESFLKQMRERVANQI